MKKTFFIILVIITTNIYAQPNIDWETNLGGNSYDRAFSMQQTNDGGYIVAGVSYSNNGDVGGNHGIYDYWIVKLDTSGGLIWETNLGGSDWDWATSIQQTTDGGYIVAGHSKSNDGDVGGNNGGYDYWIVKLNASGDLVWETSLGGSDEDKAYSIKQTSDGGYIVAGTTESNDGDIGDNNGLKDYWIVKLDASGDLVWETNLGGSHYDEAKSIQQTTDGGYIVAGESRSYGGDGDVGGNNGLSDYWIVKLDASGDLVWETNLGGSDWDNAYSIQQTTDGGYIVAGVSRSNDGDVGGNNGNNDYWIVKLDASGDLVWETNLGGSDWDWAYSIKQTSDGGYIVAGDSHSNDGDVGGNYGGNDYWIVKLDASGSLVWETNLGGSSADVAYSIQQTTNGGYIVAGEAWSHDGDVGENNGGGDYWIVKLDTDLSVGDYLINSDITLYPNPVENTFTIANLSEIITKVEILDLQGKIILVTSVIHNNTVDVSKLQAAMYIVKVYTSTNVYTQQIIKK